VVLELGGKNALVVCDDADLENAVRWALASGFSNAGQRCASASRIVVQGEVYEDFRDRLVTAAAMLEPQPVVSREAMEHILASVASAREDGAAVLTGGLRLERPGWYVGPTIVEGAGAAAPISRTELFGPVTVLYRVSSLDDAIELVNDSPYGLTAAIHTASVHRAMLFAERVQAGVVVVNAGTHGSEPHMGFGGVKNSGTGWREAGIEALDVYSDLKVVNLVIDPSKA
jgi:aldehyde dehydrogenase (NAD+)